MKTKLFNLCLLFFLLFFPLSLLAQNQTGTTKGRITGTVVQGPQNEPVGFANVVLLTPRDSSLVTGATTDISGRFVLRHVPFGRYVLRISIVGYPTKFVSNITVRENNPAVALEEVTLDDSGTRLSEVEITAERELVEYDLDKRVVNVSQDISAESGTIADVLQNVPSVTVDLDGNVSLRGSSNVTILVDGKRTSLANLSMDQIPANLIKSIEIVTNPSSKYDPEGTSGVINLILKEDKNLGLNGSATVNAGTFNNHNASVNLNYGFGKLSLNGGYDFRRRNRPGTSSTFTTYYGDSLDYIYLDQVRERQSLDINHNFRLGADYQLTPKHAISASAFYRTDYEKDTGNLLYRFLGEDRGQIGTRTRLSEEGEEGFNMDLNLGYRQTFNKEGQELTADLVFTNNADEEESEWEDQNMEVLTRQYTLTDDQNSRFTAQADYVHPFSENSRLEAGFRSSLQRLDEDASFYDYNYEINQFEFNDTISNRFVYDEHVHSLYANYSNKFRSISYQFGVRAEQTLTTADQRTQEMEYENNYFSLFPSLFVTHDINDDNKVQFSYSRRINRPRSRYLNPFVDRSDRFDVDFGNPQLDPEFINSLELGYLKYWGNSSLNISTFYRHTTDQIQRLRRPALVTENGETYTRLETTFINLSSSSAYGVELAGTHTVGKWWRLNGSLSGFRTDLNDSRGATELSNSQFSWNTRINSTMTVWKDMDIQLNTFYRAPMVTLQGRREQMFSTDIGLRKDVLNKRGTVMLRVTDIFNTRQWNYVSYEENVFRTESNNRRQNRILYIGFTYRINSDKADNSRDENRNGGGGGDSDY